LNIFKTYKTMMPSQLFSKSLAIISSFLSVSSMVALNAAFRATFRETLVLSCIGLASFVILPTVHAKVVRIEIDEVLPMPAGPGPAYEMLAGRAFGELDPKLPHNAIIQDIELAKSQDGKVRYVSSFVIYKPVDLQKSSGMMWHDVPNRGRVFAMAPEEREAGSFGKRLAR
jgi:hypothetical protein